jgi:hypothetical protein
MVLLDKKTLEFLVDFPGLDKKTLEFLVDFPRLAFDIR